MIKDWAERKAMLSPHLYGLQNILTDLKGILSWVGPYSLQKGNGTQPFTFPGISRGENSAHQLLISPGTHYCWVDRGTMGWEVCPTLPHMSNSDPLPVLPPTALSPLSFATMSQSCLTLALPSLVNHAWHLPCHHIYIATVSQTWLTIALPPSVKHGWRLPCHQSDTANFYLATSQTWLTFALPPMSRTPCPVAPNVLDIQHLHLRAIYILSTAAGWTLQCVSKCQVD